MTDEKPKAKRGFAAMAPERQREIARKGGKAAHEKGTAHEFTSEQARIAGKKGGLAVAKDWDHMSAIGKKGGVAKRRKHLKEDGIDDGPPEAA